MTKSPSAVRRKPTPAWIAVFALIAAIVAARYHLGSWDVIAPPPKPVVEGEYEVTKVIDGDTLRLADDRRVRLIGIDCPEMFIKTSPDSKPDRTRTEPWAKEATAFTEEFIAVGPVELQFDRERVDQYDRVLAYVYRDDKLLNEELIRAGLARAQTRYNYGESYKRRFRKAQAEARQAKRGIWSTGRD